MINDLRSRVSGAVACLVLAAREQKLMFTVWFGLLGLPILKSKSTFCCE